MCLIKVRNNLSYLRKIDSVNSFFVSREGLICDLLWSDPDKDVQGWGENERGVSYVFSPEIVSVFLKKHELDLICRAHQVKILLKHAEISK